LILILSIIFKIFISVLRSLVIIGSGLVLLRAIHSEISNKASIYRGLSLLLIGRKFGLQSSSIG
jgi:hypothetical protein